MLYEYRNVGKIQIRNDLSREDKNDFPNREHSVWSKGYDKV